MKNQSNINLKEKEMKKELELYRKNIDKILNISNKPFKKKKKAKQKSEVRKFNSLSWCDFQIT